MSFSFSARGTREEVVSSLEGLDNQHLGNDGMGSDLRDMLKDYISNGTDLEPPADQRYKVSAFGHSGRNSLVTLGVTVELVKFPYEDQAVASGGVVSPPLSESAQATDTLTT